MCAPGAVHSRPASTFAGELHGPPAMNLLEGLAADRAIRIGDASLPAPAAPAGPVMLGLRPEKARLAPLKGHGVPFALEAVEELGAARLLHGRVAGKEIVVAVDAGQPSPCRRRRWR